MSTADARRSTGWAAPGTLPLAVRITVPIALGIAFIIGWEPLVRYLAIPKYILPPPSLIAAALVNDFLPLIGSLWITLKVTIEAFAVALVLGVVIAILFAQSRLFEVSLFPYPVVLQVTPIVSIGPPVLIWVGLNHLEHALLILATIVAFFPILSNASSA